MSQYRTIVPPIKCQGIKTRLVPWDPSSDTVRLRRTVDRAFHGFRSGRLQYPP